MKIFSLNKAMSKSTIFGNFMLQFVVLCLRIYSGKTEQSGKFFWNFQTVQGFIFIKNLSVNKIRADRTVRFFGRQGKATKAAGKDEAGCA